MLGGTSLTTTASPRIFYAFIYLFIYLQERLYLPCVYCILCVFDVS